MKQSLFKSQGKFYKANLHTHTTISDGHTTPEQVKEIYKNDGFSIVAYTDHNILIDHSSLNDDSFLAISGMEYDFNEDIHGAPYSFMRTYHILLLSKDPSTEYYPCANPDYTYDNEYHNEKKYVQPYYKGDFIREYSAESVNILIKEAHEHGFLTCYCHPAWSLQNYTDYCDLKDVDFVEAYNTGCYITGFDLDKCDHVFHDFLVMGKRVLPASNDDLHWSENALGCGTYIKADNLSYESVFEAIENKDVYASWGPEIKDIWYDPHTRHIGIDTSGAKEIFLLSERRFCQYKINGHGGRIFNADFDIGQYVDDTLTYGEAEKSFLRFIVRDSGGDKAISRAYYIDELLNRK